ncbi:MAG: serine hydroxymethyltransferase [Desulfobacterales bacterium]|jgi:glycine hydroxymethyltransferase
MRYLPIDDPEMASLIEKEGARIEDTLDLIAAENHPPLSILEAMGSVLNTKTIEGYPGHRFHAGCVHADAVEALAVSRAKRLFGADHVNVQPHSGTSANLAVYFSVLKVGDRVLSMSLPHGGHLSHGHRASITSQCFHFEHYGLSPETERLDYDDIEARARRFNPRMIVAGASAYPRLIDYGKLATIAESVSAYFLVDMAHIAGLVAAGAIPSPVPHSDFVTFTGYKTMMGGRGGVILAKAQYGKRIDRAVFPGTQGTSPVSAIAAKAMVFKLAATPAFAEIQQRTIDNARLLAGNLGAKGHRIVTGGTDNHQVLVDLSRTGLSGGTAEKRLEEAGIMVNRNTVPRDAETPGAISGIRLGTAALSTRGMGPEAMDAVAGHCHQVLSAPEDREGIRTVRKAVTALCRRYPVYPGTVPVSVLASPTGG